MNGSNTPSPELPLPKPSPETGLQSVEALAGIEIKTGATDSMSQGPATPMPMVDPSQFASVSQAPSAVISDDHTSQDTAEDADVIEKEWVNKAKAIVNKTKDNPNVQSKELGKFKAEYIKKRFNKEMKVAKDTASEL